LNRPSLRHLKGPNTIRAFLYAREHWPERSFIRTAPAAFMALYNSRLRDGLPRVIYVVSKEVEAPLRGKMGSVLRHKFKRKGKSAFKHALEGLRKDDPSYSSS
jgi:RNase P protein component